TVAGLAQFQAEQDFNELIVQQGVDDGYVQKGPGLGPDGQPLVELAPSPAARYAPLKGWYGPAEMAEGLKEMAAKPDRGRTMKFLMGVTGYAMATKTVFSAKATVRNYVGNVLFMVANGHVVDRNFASNFGTAAASTFADVFKREGAPGLRARIEEYVARGIMDDNVTEETLKNLLSVARTGDAAKADTMISKLLHTTHLQKLVVDPAKGATDMAVSIYGAMDDFWKIVAYEGELARLKGARTGTTNPSTGAAWSLEEIKMEAAFITRETMPTYSMAAQWVKFARRNPVLAPYVTFWTEVVRSSTGILRVAKAEIKDPNPKIKSHGYQRLAWFGTALATPQG
ncbi:MAG: hypothetical protein Q8R28_10260, partial [Dehalococcoidia bacterium]|nr:hypothetical protein [Dehalococcoidia bacterium]